MIYIIKKVVHFIITLMPRDFAEIPAVLKLLSFFSFLSIQTQTPEGQVLFINPLLHTAYQYGIYEPEVRETVLSLTKSGMVAYDIGANVGVFSLLFSSIVGKSGMVYAFEPEKNNYTCLEKSIVGIDNITLDKRAIGSADGMADFDRRGGAFSGRLVGKGRYEVSENVGSIEVVSLDRLVFYEGYRPPNIIKIDVEGNEGMVLKGMSGILDVYKPIIICELHTHLGDSVETVKNILIKCGYNLEINGNRLIATTKAKGE